ncbi:lipoprotein-anchoring transpeptidase ErfK/SrfK [Sphingobium fontiphilum]|uniref:Lipoprotein-anchoring transpeptidase ErfK/SrfK n=1 Tax=Sphingobium fontiphilum TaxID=944425 RepID=A0A7W6GMX5_9SPHN|nr:L,D-transpeptidase family protein [Sphingobium fontiphilum]MBB3980733.1 lipoprotein-anchoring transpeptidase ErfK/SrfK [Sphingobium fontiphilum]
MVKSLIRSVAPKLLLGGGVLALAAVVTGLAERAPGETPPAPQPTPQPKPAQIASAQPIERSRNQPVEVEKGALVVRRVLPIQPPFRHGDYMWDENGAPADGRIIVTIDLKAQTLSVFRDGYEIGAAVIIYGADNKPSPLGAFPITEKDADHVSNLYDAPMPYMLRLTNDGVAIHGSDVQWGNATHGCIGVPTPFAEKLFKVAKLGDLVIITNGRMLDTSKAQRGA